jgi:hypothetical protein
MRSLKSELAKLTKNLARQVTETHAPCSHSRGGVPIGAILSHIQLSAPNLCLISESLPDQQLLYLGLAMYP